MIALTVAAQKGGTGKTTTCLAVGQAMARRGLRVLLIDADPQATLTVACGADRSAPGTAEVMGGRTSAADAVQATPMGDVLGGARRLAGPDSGSRRARESVLARALGGADLPYDVAIIDTPPGEGAMLGNALRASDAVIMTALADAFSYQGVDALAATMEGVRTPSGRRLEAVAIVVNRYRRTRIGARMLAAFEASAPELGRACAVHTVRECTAVQEAAAAGRGLLEYAPRCTAAQDYVRCADAVLEALGGCFRRRPRRRGWRRPWPTRPRRSGPPSGRWRRGRPWTPRPRC